MRADRQTDVQTDRQTDTLIAIVRILAGDDLIIMMLCQMIHVDAKKTGSKCTIIFLAAISPNADRF